MGRRKKIQSEKNPETLICKREVEEEEEEEEKGDGAKEGKGFFACYLLSSLSPRHKRHTYIGFTVNPRRRIRQHNGEIGGGAFRTKTMRPWEMVLCIHGFPTNVSALQFEWAWQNPMQSVAVRKAAASFKSLYSIANKIKLAYTMLTLPAWQSLNLTINFFSTKYTKHSSGCPCLPEQMKVQVRPMDELPCYMEGEYCLHDNEDERDGEDECNEVESANDFMKEGLANVTSDLFADCHDSIEMQSRVQDGWMEENGIKQPWDSLSSKEDHRHPFQLIESPMKKLASVASSSSTGETAKDWGFIDLDRTIEKRSTISDNIKDQPAVNTEQNGTRQLWDSPTSKEDCRYPFQFIESPVKQLASLDSFSSTEDTTKDWGFIDEYSIDLDQPTRKRSPLITGDDKGQPPIIFTASREVEVIDVLTPSPDCRISLCSKKRRVCPEIIDLTKSPAFVQL